MAKPKGRLYWVRWYPEDVLGGTELLEPLLELTYRRLLDYMAMTNNQLKDDDQRLARLTKAGRRWKAHKAALLALGKITITDGIITNLKMSVTLGRQQDLYDAQVRRSRHGAAARWGTQTEETDDENANPESSCTG